MPFCNLHLAALWIKAFAQKEENRLDSEQPDKMFCWCACCTISLPNLYHPRQHEVTWGWALHKCIKSKGDSYCSQFSKRWLHPYMFRYWGLRISFIVTCYKWLLDSYFWGPLSAVSSNTLKYDKLDSCLQILRRFARWLWIDHCSYKIAEQFRIKVAVLTRECDV